MTFESPSSPSPRRDDLAALRLDRGRARPPKRRLGLWAGLVLALVAGTAAIRLAVGSPPTVTVVEARAVAASQAPRAEELSGSGYVVTGDRYVSIGALVAGRIDRYHVEEGESVSADDPLVQLDDREYRAEVARLEASLASASASHALAEAELRRGRRLFEEGVLAAQELDTLESRGRVTRAAIEQTQAELALAKVRLEYTTLRAPADGVVLAKLKEVGEIAVPGGFAGSGDLVRLANLGDLRAEIDVNESDLDRVRLGQPATVTPDAHPGADYESEVVKLYPQVDRQKGTLRVEVRILEPDERLLPDMSVRVRFLGERRADGRIILVPSSAVQHDESGAAHVWEVGAARMRRREVDVDGSAGDRTRVVGGLVGGETIVAASSRPLRDGDRPKVVDALDER